MMNVNFVQAKFGEEKDYEASLRRLRGEDADIFQEATEIRVNFELFLIRNQFLILHFSFFGINAKKKRLAFFFSRNTQWPFNSFHRVDFWTCSRGYMLIH